MVLTRAFACALPAVASDIPGYREVLTPEAAVSVAPDDPDALVDAVCALVDDEPRREAMGEAARALARRALRVAGDRGRLEAVYAERDRARPRRGASRVTSPLRVTLARRVGRRPGSSSSRSSLASSLIWWRGPDWGSVLDAFSS